MNNNYSKSISLRCNTCGETSFEYNEDKTWIKCNRCSREYHRGYDELVELNQAEIDVELSVMKKEVTEDLKKDFTQMLKDALKGNKNIKLK
ncbi:hypothetical protein [Elizabethkingia ursingii]|uniref:hypothetical protein n=1 Tax=Elizabethkingia ursingii TaxID=1756150 RepID=UPI00075164A8|nr:hypothetical protein [Elizabethkingia ursingii]KUY30038.1 hypothetical protein ATB96_15795 [Elizabethkingia ursingii]